MACNCGGKKKKPWGTEQSQKPKDDDGKSQPKGPKTSF